MLRPEEIVIKEGDVDNSLYLITKGEVCSYKWNRLKIDSLSDGDSFGEACFLARSLSRKGNHRLSLSHIQLEKIQNLIEKSDENFCDASTPTDQGMHKQISNFANSRKGQSERMVF